MNEHTRKKLYENPYHAGWLEKYGRLKQFIKNNKRWPRRKEKLSEGFNIGGWISVQRTFLHKNRLLAWRKKLLDDIGFPWNAKRCWMDCYNEFIMWKNEKNRLPDSRSNDPLEKKLYRWMISQRSEYNRGTLSEKKTALLEKEGLFYNFEEKVWQGNLKKIQQFIQTHNRYPLKSKNTGKKEKKLAVWRSRNVTLLNNGNLEEKYKRLFLKAQLDISSKEYLWSIKLDKVKEFINKHNRFPQVQSGNTVEKALARWRYIQNNLYKQRKMSPNKLELYKQSGLTETVFKKNWYANLKKVHEFKKLFGRLPAFSHHSPEEDYLADWCQKQRVYYKHDIYLNQQKKSVLQGAGILNRLNYKDRWKVTFEKFEVFYKTNKRLPEITGGGDEKKLYNWFIVNLRYLHNGQLRSDRAEFLQNYDHLFTPRNKRWQNRWNVRFSQLRSLREDLGRLPVPQTENILEKKVALWLTYQRTLMRKGILARYRYSTLKQFMEESRREKRRLTS